jgi:hypothetical protein
MCGKLEIIEGGERYSWLCQGISREICVEGQMKTTENLIASVWTAYKQDVL